MEKLSSIIPSNARIKSVDLKDAKPRRPGAPSLGMPMGVTSVKDRVNLSGATQAQAEDLLVYRNPKEMRHAKIAEDTTRKFFETRLQETPEPKNSEMAEERLTQEDSVQQSTLAEVSGLEIKEPLEI